MHELRDPIQAQDADFSYRYLTVEDGVELLLYEWRPRDPRTEDPLIFVAGYISHINGWADLLRRAVKRGPVYYLESREKSSARIARKGLRRDDFNIERMAGDLVEVCGQLPVDMDRAVVAGSSLGSTALVEAMKHGGIKPKAAFLIGVNAEFHFPWFAPAILKLPTFLYHVVKYLLFWYLKYFRVDGKREPEQLERYRATVLRANPLRIKLSGQSLRRYRIWDELETVRTPVAVAYAESDKLHGSDNIKRLAKALPRGRAMVCPSNKYMHTAAVLDEMESFLQDL